MHTVVGSHTLFKDVEIWGGSWNLCKKSFTSLLKRCFVFACDNISNRKFDIIM